MDINLLRLDDLAAAVALSTQAGWNQTPEDWRRILALSPDGCFAGRLDGRLVATATSAAPAPGIQWIGMVLVDREMRGRGFGTLLLDRALAHARRAEVVGLDATDQGRPLYLKMGFHDVAPIDRWGGALSQNGPSVSCPIERVLEIDREALGVDRSALLRRLAGEPDVRLLASDDGYALLRPGRTVWHLGPMVAADPAPLLRAAGGLLRGAPLIVDVPRRPELEAVFAAQGLSILRRLTRMTWGVPRSALLAARAAAAVSFEWG
ncbi:MAG TPA: GNAT family N-acetyltransferase [Planctomycetota bacterium]